MIKTIAFWFSFLATATLFSSYSMGIASLLNSISKLENPFKSSAHLFGYSWSVLPPLLAIIALPFLVRRISLVLAKRSLVSPRFGAVPIGLLIIFFILLTVVYGTKLIPDFRPLAFGAGILKLWFSIPILLAYILAEITSFLGDEPVLPEPARDNRRTVLISAGIVFVASLAIELARAHPAIGGALVVYKSAMFALIFAAGVFICIYLAKERPQLTPSKASIAISIPALIFALIPISGVLALIFVPILGAVTHSNSAILLMFVTSTLALFSLVLNIVTATATNAITASVFNRRK